MEENQDIVLLGGNRFALSTQNKTTFCLTMMPPLSDNDQQNTHAPTQMPSVLRRQLRLRGEKEDPKGTPKENKETREAILKESLRLKAPQMVKKTPPSPKSKQHLRKNKKEEYEYDGTATEEEEEILPELTL
jgi:hypothetical protein